MYDVYGTLIPVTPIPSKQNTLGILNPFRYRTYVWDEEASLYYLEARFYNACLQKFIIPDLLLGSLNSLLTNSPYTYCRNNAINMADNGGLWPKWLGAVATAVVATIIVAAAMPAAVCTASVALATYAISSTAITVGVAAVGTFALSSHYSNAIEAVTGTNPIRDVVLGGNDEAYDYYQLATHMAGAGVLHMAAVSPGVCFIEGTPILTENGFKPIEEIAVGERVWAQDVETGECVLKCVLHTFINEENEFMHIYIDEEEIVCTMEHPFYVVGKGWIPARDLKKCDELRVFDGKTTCVKSVVYEEKAETVAVYNFEVDEFHTYFVGASCVLVHNRCKLGKNLSKIVKDPGEGYHAHHVFPQEFRTRFDAIGIKIDNGIYGSWVKASEHLSFSRAYNRAWENFFKRNPNPTMAQTLDHAKTLAERYGFETHF